MESKWKESLKCHAQRKSEMVTSLVPPSVIRHDLFFFQTTYQAYLGC